MVPRHGLNGYSGLARPSGLEARHLHTCGFCGAQHFSEELVRHEKNWSASLCCMHGKLRHVERVPGSAYPVSPGRQMSTLLAHPDFRRDIRRYNAAVSFVSFADTGGNVTRHLPGRGPYTYAVQGQVYHSMSSLDPPEGQTRAYGQLYFYAPDEALEHRLSIFDGLDRTLLLGVQKILYYDVRASSSQCPPTAVHYNPYVMAFHNMYTLWHASTPDHKLLRFQFQTGVTPDPRRYNTPTAAEVAAIYDGEAPPLTRGICVYPAASATGGSTYSPSFLSDHLDPLSYPILFPDGQRGWHAKLYYYTAPGVARTVRQYISQAEFYSHRFMTRDPLQPQGPIVESLASGSLRPPQMKRRRWHNDLGPPALNARACQSSMPHAGGRLFQQFCVDVFTRIEAERTPPQSILNGPAQPADPNIYIYINIYIYMYIYTYIYIYIYIHIYL